MHEYKVLPFIGKLKKGQGADEASKQLDAMINTFAVDGWEFYQLADVNIEVAPGCLAGILGADVSYIRFDQLVFRRAKA
jgi:hypothetical protein